MADLAILDEKPIRVTADGRWLHGDDPLHPRVEALFKRSVVPTADGWILEVGDQRAELQVADTPFAVTTLDLEEEADVLTFSTDQEAAPGDNPFGAIFGEEEDDEF